MGLFRYQHGATLDDYGNMVWLSNPSWYNAWVFWYEEDFHAAVD